jgi:predicted nucleic acid-binding protein
VDFALFQRGLDEGWLKVLEIEAAGWRSLNPGVDPGEASIIHAALMLRAAGDKALLLIDDRAGRAEARQHDIPLMGSAAVIGMAKIKGLIPAALPLLEQMSQNGYFLGQSVIDAILAETGELR